MKHLSYRLLIFLNLIVLQISWAQEDPCPLPDNKKAKFKKNILKPLPNLIRIANELAKLQRLAHVLFLKYIIIILANSLDRLSTVKRPRFSPQKNTNKISISSNINLVKLI